MGCDFEKKFKKFKEDNILNNKNEFFNEMTFERIYSSSDERLKFIMDWYNICVSECTMSYEIISLDKCKQWSVDPVTGSIVHDSGEFFRVDGIRVHNSTDREVTGGWEQPILTQVGYNGGILGLIRKYIDGIPHYLVEAKAEPGNYNIVQISPTVQATFSNLKKAHKGNKTRFSEYFLEPEKYNGEVIFKRWMSEDGGRLLNKKNLSMIVNLSESVSLDIPKNFLWVTLWELVQLIRTEDAVVAPHIRGIVAAL